MNDECIIIAGDGHNTARIAKTCDLPVVAHNLYPVTCSLLSAFETINLEHLQAKQGSKNDNFCNWTKQANQFNIIQQNGKKLR